MNYVCNPFIPPSPKDQKYAELRTWYLENPLTGDWVFSHFEWMGDPHLPIHLSDFQLEHLPFPVEKRANPDPDKPYWLWSDRIYYRTDVGMWYAYYRFQSDVFWFVNKLRWIGAALIMTAMVWGLAYVTPGEYPGWRHLGKKRD